jgi:hypothetical protein
VNFCLKWIVNSFLVNFLRPRGYTKPCGLKCPRVEGLSAKEEICFAHRILGFHFLNFFVLTHGST